MNVYGFNILEHMKDLSGFEEWWDSIEKSRKAKIEEELDKLVIDLIELNSNSKPQQ